MVAIVTAFGLASSRSNKSTAQHATQRSRFADLIGGFRWVSDQESLELLRTTDPAMLEHGRQRMLESLISRARLLRCSCRRPMKHVALRSVPAIAGRDVLARSSAKVVQQRHLNVDEALSALSLSSRS